MNYFSLCFNYTYVQMYIGNVTKIIFYVDIRTNNAQIDRAILSLNNNRMHFL